MDGPLPLMIFYVDPTVMMKKERVYVLPVLNSVRIHYPLRKDHPVPTGGRTKLALPSSRNPRITRASSCKDKNNGVLAHSRVRGETRASILSQFAAIACLSKRAFRFILNVSLRIRKLFTSNDKKLYRELFLPSPIPGYLKGIVQIE